MKKTLMIATTAAMLFSGAAASAQPYGDRNHNGRPNVAERGHDRDRDGRDHGRDRHDNRRAHWQKGQRFDHYKSRAYVVSDYRHRGWRAPPRGYQYYRTDSGDVVLAAVATGIIASVIANSR